MNEQLTKNQVLTLDTTCSELKVWPPTAVIRMDIRREARPDIVASAAALPFRDFTFNIEYCDPPFTIRSRKHMRHTDHGFIKRMERYGCWGTRQRWEAFLKSVDAEFYRTLKPGGHVEFKLMDSHEDSKWSDLQLLTNFSSRIKKKWLSKAANWRGKKRAPVAIFELRPRPVA